MTAISPYCLATTVTPKALKALLENTGAGAYRDAHPWLVACEMFEAAQTRAQRMALLIASGEPLEFRQWGWIESIDVVELHRGQWESRCSFGRLEPVHQIWSGLDSVFLKPGDDQLRRESLEPIRQHRTPLDALHIHPYAICEAPAFLGLTC
ncbi:MAG: hypothetical protein E2O54_02630 [Gammaproteobacteria bacterium]|nr:MAG: hypothetical protein E2O54_02630 [Gammaproteobacteria bacterium]